VQLAFAVGLLSRGGGSTGATGAAAPGTFEGGDQHIFWPQGLFVLRYQEILPFFQVFAKFLINFVSPHRKPETIEIKHSRKFYN
jgi:hypothetical protein